MPKRSCDRKINEFVKRVRALKVHLLILQHLRKKMPALMFKQSSQQKILNSIDDHFHTVMRQNHLAVGDFPQPAAFSEILASFDLSKFPKVTDKMLARVDEALQVSIPKLVRSFGNPM